MTVDRETDERWAVEDRPAPLATSGRPLSARGLRTRRQLLDAAEQVFAELGYPDASIVKITEAAGVAQGTFYLYFESKQQVFDEVVDDLNHRVRRAMTEGASQGTTRAERERLGFRGFFRFTAEHPALYRIIRQAEFASPEALHRHYERIATGYIDGLRDAMGEGEIVDADPEVLAWMLMGIGEIVGMRWILWGDTDAVPDAVFDEMYRFITRGLGAEDDA
ncbi:MAG: TetR/AcrR family transcriptional regulator [Nitriliruptorales bacterium]|nr:TetR/AcrR family transcriptional regulator [Nitriliruptorales bacterium]